MMKLRGKLVLKKSWIYLLILLAIWAVLLQLVVLWQKNKLSRNTNLANNTIYLRPANQPVDQTNCFSQSGTDGYELKANQITVYPRCLGVLNSRFGSRFNFDWFFSDQKINSGLLGTFQDSDIGFSIRGVRGNQSEQLFPLAINGESPKVSVNLGLTYETVTFSTNDYKLVMTITSPFSPSQKFSDQDNKISSSPFFYLDFDFTALTKNTFDKIVINLNNAGTLSQKDQMTVAYLADSSVTSGKRALAISDQYPAAVLSFRNGQLRLDWDLKASDKSSISLVYAGYLPDTAINDLAHKPLRSLNFAYTSWFKNLDEVIDWALENKDEILAKTTNFEQQLNRPELSGQEKWILAQAFHSYLSNTWLVVNNSQQNDFDYLVWEGEFKYLNTVDVAHDYAVLEGLYMPWVIKNELQLWQQAAKKDSYGMVIPHDLGRGLNLEGIQAYKIDQWQTSGMPVEENLNFILLSYWYYNRTQDQEFVKNSLPFIKELYHSVRSRDTNGNGLPDVGIGMTTYDNDGNSALKESPDSVYLGLKMVGAWEGAKILAKTERDDLFFQELDEDANLIANTLQEIYERKGFLPLSLDEQFKEKNLFDNQQVKGIDETGFTIVSGLFYPALTNLDSPSLNIITTMLSKAFPVAYDKSLVKNDLGHVYGLQLAENQDLALGWLSHSLMADTIAKRILKLDYQSEQYFFPFMYDSPFGYTDGYYFKNNGDMPRALLYYPRGAAAFGRLVP
jgi:hypothetical protein